MGRRAYVYNCLSFNSSTWSGVQESEFTVFGEIAEDSISSLSLAQGQHP